jgi:hypothetical protein
LEDFFRRVIVVFCWGFWENRAGKRDVSVVNLWWICGETWRFVAAFLSTENLPRLTDLFWGFPFWELGRIQGGDCPLSSGE